MKNIFFGEQLQILRKQKILTQQELGYKSGFSRNSIAQFENRKDVPKLSILKKLCDALNVSLSYFLEPKQQQETQTERYVSDENTLVLPILASIPAGMPEYCESDIEGTLRIPKILFPGAKFIVHCCGESMEPEINKNDYCIIKPTTELIYGKIMLVKTEEGFSLKRIIKVGKDVQLKPSNKNYKTTKPKELKIIGQVVGRVEKFD